MEENAATARPRYPAHVTGVTSGILLVTASACQLNSCKLRVAPVRKHPAQRSSPEFHCPGHLAAAEPHLSSSMILMRISVVDATQTWLSLLVRLLSD